MPRGKQKKSATREAPKKISEETFELELETQKNTPLPSSIKPKKAQAPQLSPQKNDGNISFWKKIAKSLAEIGTIPVSEKIFFAENFKVMIKAGLSISEAMETLALQTRSKKFASVLNDIRSGVLEGNTLGGMLEKYPRIFPEYFINMIKIGELSGNLENNLGELSNQMKKDHEIVSKVKGAMIYPAVIVVATIGIGVMMFVYVIPSMLSIFEEMSLDLPLATKILIAISKFINANGIFLVVAAVTLVTALILFSRTAKGKAINHFLLLNLWIIGPIVKKINLARFSRTLSSLLKTDIPVIESFKITSTVLSNTYYKKISLNSSEDLSQGATVTACLLKAPKLFPPLVTQMVSVGEKSGTLDELLSELANFYESEVSDITKNLSSIIEPILIVFLGGIVALIAFAVISPIYSLSQGI
ncbi:MAG: type II secretion system F family protein [Patescibacteria group bacterium]